MESITTLSRGWVALNSLTSGVAAVIVLLRAQNTTVPVALLPNVAAVTFTGSAANFVIPVTQGAR